MFKPNSQNDEFIPTCLPSLPDSINPGTQICQSAIRRLAIFFGATDQFDLSEISMQPVLGDDNTSSVGDIQEPVEEIS